MGKFCGSGGRRNKKIKSSDEYSKPLSLVDSLLSRPTSGIKEAFFCRSKGRLFEIKMENYIPEDNSAEMIYHRNRRLATVAGAIICARFVNSHSVEPGVSIHKKIILHFANFHSLHATSENTEPLLIDALVEHCPFMLEDWSAWTEVLLDPELEKGIAQIVANMMTSCVWITSSGFVPKLRLKDAGHRFQLEVCPRRHEKMTAHFVTVFPQLINAHRSTHMLEVLTLIPNFFVINKTRSLEDIYDIFEDLFVNTDNIYVDYQITQFFKLVSQNMSEPPEWYTRVILRQKGYCELLKMQFQVVFDQWYNHNYEEGPYYNDGTLCFSLSKISSLCNINDPTSDEFIFTDYANEGIEMLLKRDLLRDPAYFNGRSIDNKGWLCYYLNTKSTNTNIIDPLDEVFTNCAIKGIEKLFNEDLLKRPSNYRVANLLGSLFFFGALKMKIYMQQYLNEDSVDEFLACEEWTSIKVGLELYSNLLNSEWPLYLRKFNFMLYTEILIKYAEMTKSNQMLKNFKLKPPTYTVKKVLAEILRFSVPVHIFPSDVDEEGCRKRLNNFCRLIQLNILNCHYIGDICYYFSFYKDKTLYQPILKKTCVPLLEDRKVGVLVAGIMMDFIKKMYNHGQHLVQYEEVARGMLAIMPRKGVKIARPLLNFVRKGIDFAAHCSIDFLPLLSKFATRMPRSKVEIILPYFRRHLHNHFRNPHYKSFDQALGEIVRGHSMPRPIRVKEEDHEFCLCCYVLR